MRRTVDIQAVGPLNYAPGPPPPPSSSTARLVAFFVTHIVGWAVIVVVAVMLSRFVAPRFERMAEDFGLRLPTPTAALLRISFHLRNGTAYPLLAFLAVVHALAAAVLLSRGGRGRVRLYRLVLTLVLGVVVLFLVLAVFLPIVGLINGLAGGSGR